MPVVCAASLILNVVLIGLGIWGLNHRFIVVPSPALDTAAVALTAATVAITLIGTIIAIVAFVGYREIQRKSAEIARSEAAKVADRVTREVASPLILRGVFETLTTEMTDQEATDFAGAAGEGHQNG